MNTVTIIDESGEHVLQYVRDFQCTLGPPARPTSWQFVKGQVAMATESALRDGFGRYVRLVARFQDCIATILDANTGQMGTTLTMRDEVGDFRLRLTRLPGPDPFDEIRDVFGDSVRGLPVRLKLVQSLSVRGDGVWTLSRILGSDDEWVQGRDYVELFATLLLEEA